MSRLKEKGFSLFGATMDGEDTRNITYPEKRALIMGNEHSGLSNKIIKKLDKQITIKMKNDFDSLNVSSAAAILIDKMK
jgi:23S rRNA (guanosine2251-2'-O)-methyltransferase